MYEEEREVNRMHRRMISPFLPSMRGMCMKKERGKSMQSQTSHRQRGEWIAFMSIFLHENSEAEEKKAKKRKKERGRKQVNHTAVLMMTGHHCGMCTMMSRAMMSIIINITQPFHSSRRDESKQQKLIFLI